MSVHWQLTHELNASLSRQLMGNTLYFCAGIVVHGRREPD